jgi:DNA-binding response OmpR family regulator
VFLDVDMPGMNGFELCTKLRALPFHKKTPIVFVTSLNDFESRANSTMSGGNDFIGKPFLFIELAVKALIHVQRGRLVPAR